MYLDIEKVRLAQARAGLKLTPGEAQLLQRTRKGKEIRPDALHRLSVKLGVDPAELIRTESEANR